MSSLFFQRPILNTFKAILSPSILTNYSLNLHTRAHTLKFVMIHFEIYKVKVSQHTIITKHDHCRLARHSRPLMNAAVRSVCEWTALI